MTKQYISAISGHLPDLRFSRVEAIKAMKWSGLGGRKDGYRAIANWDEDPLTMAVESSRDLCTATNQIDELVFASTSAYFTDRQQSTTMIDALNLDRSVPTQDVANSRRCAISALRRALHTNQNTIISAAEKRKTAIGSPDQLLYGDGAAACLVSDKGGARLIGCATTSYDFLDRFTSVDQTTPYAYEARFVRQTAVSQILAPTINAACDDAGISPADITVACVHEPIAGSYKALARSTGLTAPNIADNVMAKAGDLGAAHVLFSLGLAFAAAKKGDIILAAGFGSGCDVLIFRIVSPVAGANKFTDILETGTELVEYVRFLNLCGNLDINWGMRSEASLKGQATVYERYGRDMIGFIGGRDSLGNVQFPKSDMPINPNIDKPETLTDVCLSGEHATIVSLTFDRLNFNPDPPFIFGLVQFDNGARVMMEMVDPPKQSFAVGQRVKMNLRIKFEDKCRGYRTYFWKATSIDRDTVEKNDGEAI